jgi:SET domain-containing protein
MVKQTVYCEVQDARLPRMAFFAARAITAGEELTWDYEYEIGRFEGRAVMCACGEPNCRGRLL